MTKRINPFTDFGFKYIFGQESSKAYLIDFLNALLEKEPGFESIEDITYADKEHLGASQHERGIIYDINCTSSSGKQFIVEMQNGQQSFFIDRSIYYCARAIEEQGRHGRDWKYNIKPVYTVAFINFEMQALGDNFRTDVALCDMDTKEPVSDKIRFIYLQLNKFKKTKEEDCENIFEWWIYNLKNMETMEQLAFTQQHRLFQRLSDVTEYAALSKEERRAYDADLKAYRDLTNTIEYAKEFAMEQGMAQGIEKGIEKGETQEKEKTARLLAENGMGLAFIEKITGLTPERIRNIVGKD